MNTCLLIKNNLLIFLNLKISILCTFFNNLTTLLDSCCKHDFLLRGVHLTFWSRYLLAKAKAICFGFPMKLCAYRAKKTLSRWRNFRKATGLKIENSFAYTNSILSPSFTTRKIHILRRFKCNFTYISAKDDKTLKGTVALFSKSRGFDRCACSWLNTFLRPYLVGSENSAIAKILMKLLPSFTQLVAVGRWFIPGLASVTFENVSL